MLIADTMRKLHPEIIHHKGKPQFAVIPYAEFLAIQDELEDAACLRALRKAKASEQNAKTNTLGEIKAKLGLPAARKRRSAAVA